MQKRFRLKFLYKYLFILVFLLYVQTGRSQTVYQGNLYPYNKYQLNPAYAGVCGQLSSVLSYRSASSNIQGTPKQLMFGLHLPVFNKMGLGGRIENQSEGLFNFFTGFVDYSYSINLNKSQSIRFGISAGIQSSQLDQSKIIATDPSAIIEIASGNFLGTDFQTASGIVYLWKDLEISIAAPRLFGTAEAFNSSFTGNIFYNFNTINDELTLSPSVFILYKPNTPPVYDLNLIANFQDKFMFGLGYRNRPGIVLTAGVSFANIQLNYAAELSAEKYANIFNTFHEISIAYQFKKVKSIPSDSLYNPPLDLIVDNDSINNDSINSITSLDTISEILGQHEINAEQDTLLNADTHSANSEFEVIEVGDGVFMLKPHDEGTESINDNLIDSLINTDVFYKKNDIQTNADPELDKTNKKLGKYQVLELANGIYTIKENGSLKDISNDITDELIDSICAQPDAWPVSNKNSKSDNSNENSVFYHEVYFTVQVFINSESNILTEDYELLEQLRVEKRASGKINYYYGKFSEKKSAENARKHLMKKGVTDLEVLKVSAYR